MPTLENTPKHTPKPETKKQPLFTKREIRFLASTEKKNQSSFEIAHKLSQQTVTSIRNLVKEDEAYKLISVRPNKHFHKYILKKVDDGYSMVFLDDESESNKKNFNSIQLFIDDEGKVTVTSILSDSYIFDTSNLEELKDVTTKIIKASFEKEIPQIVGDVNVNNIETKNKPSSTQIVYPNGKVSKTFTMSKEELKLQRRLINLKKVIKS